MDTTIVHWPVCPQRFVVYGGDARDAYAHAPAPEMMTHLTIDNAYFGWYKEKTDKTLNHRFVLPVLHSLQGYIESGKMWMNLIDQILINDLGFATTTKGRCIYIKKIEEGIILLLQQIDDFCCLCTDEQDAKNIYNMIGTKIQFQSKRDKGHIPFEYLGLVKDYNDTDLVQTKKYIEMNCSNYVNRFLKSHDWDVASDQPDAAPTTVINSRCWDDWMEAKRLVDLEEGFTSNNVADVKHAPAASIITTGLSSVHVNSPAPDLSDNELVTLQLKDKKPNNNFAPMLTLPKGKVKKN